MRQGRKITTGWIHELTAHPHWHRHASDARSLASGSGLVLSASVMPSQLSLEPRAFFRREIVNLDRRAPRRDRAGFALRTAARCLRGCLTVAATPTRVGAIRLRARRDSGVGLDVLAVVGKVRLPVAHVRREPPFLFLRQLHRRLVLLVRLPSPAHIVRVSLVILRVRLGVRVRGGEVDIDFGFRVRGGSGFGLDARLGGARALVGRDASFSCGGAGFDRLLGLRTASAEGEVATCERDPAKGEGAFTDLLERALRRIIAEEVTRARESALLGDAPARLARYRRLPPRRSKLDRTPALARRLRPRRTGTAPPPTATLFVRAAARQRRELLGSGGDLGLRVDEGSAGRPEAVAGVARGAQLGESGAEFRVDLEEILAVVHLADVCQLQGQA